MLVYGEVERLEDAAELTARVRTSLGEVEVQAPGLKRHAALVSAFLAAADLVQGCIEAEFEAQGCDDISPASTAGMRLLTALAQCVDRSWISAFMELGDPKSAAALLDGLTCPQAIIVKPLEGFAFYALYPESYAEAARNSGLPAETRVIGIRSIGTSLAAMVAAAIHAEPPMTVRPVGHPFDRRLAISDALAEAILAGSPPAYAIVDEGPGLSGSSFGAVADWLEGRGIDRGLIHAFPSHPNPPGPKVSAAHRERWRSLARHVKNFEALTLEAEHPAHRLASWVSELVGPLDAVLQDISGGAWRMLTGGLAPDSIPAAPQWERRKFLARRGEARWLVKFAGLGQEGERKLRLAQSLHEAGFAPEPAGLCHGFLVQRWVAGQNLAFARVERRTLVERLGRYLAFRSAMIAAPAAGANLSKLAEMAIYNAGQALGGAAASALEHRLGDAAALDASVSRVEIDARLHRWEWVVRPDGALLKTDGLDHGHAHDFVGTQDIAWDVAGAIVEHELNPEEVRLLTHLVRFDQALLQFLLPCYLAFQLGAWTMSSGGSAITQRYISQLRELI